VSKANLKLASSNARSAEREALARAIERHAGAIRDLKRIEEAQEIAMDRWFAADRDVERVKDALAQATEATAGRALADSLLGRDLPATTADAARAAVDAAEAALATIRAARDELEADKSAAQDEVATALGARDKAVLGVLRGSGEVADAITETEAAHLAFNGRSQVVALLMEKHLFSYEERVAISRAIEVPESSHSLAWRAWLAALETDADAELAGRAA
jgi:hypothetical protein